MFDIADLEAGSWVARDPRTGSWVSYEPWELPDDTDLAHGVPPDGYLDDELTALLARGSGAGDAVRPGEWAVEDVPAGPELAASLAAVELPAMSTFDVVEQAAGWQRLVSWAQAEQARALAELVSRPELRPGESGYRSVNPVTNTALEVAARTVVTARQAENLVGHAAQLVEDFPATHRAFAAGSIDERRVRVITGELGGQEPHVRQRVEAAVLPAAPAMDSVALRRRIRRLVHELAPVQAEQRCTEARARRDVTVTPAPDGMAFLEAYLPAADAMAVKSVLDGAASTFKAQDAASGCPARTLAQGRADALAALAWAALDTQRIGATPDASGQAPVPLASAQGRAVAVQVTFPFRSLIGLTDEPGEIEGYGPIPARMARQLAAAGVWRWVGTDPASGRYAGHGASRYRPTRALVEQVVLRDRTCRAPGCHRPAAGCDIDHRVAHGGGGPTSACNCHPLCRTHHLLKHRGRWRVEHEQRSGATVWTSPTGHTYPVPPESIGPTGKPPGLDEPPASPDAPPY